MYQALYRKYRPNILEEVVGQEIITKTLKNAILGGKLSHAYLFTGPRGTGKTSIAKILAKTVNCSDLKGIEPCDKCTSCMQINQKQSTDIIEIDAASNNGVDEIREIRNKVNLVPSISKYKVYIIDEVHMLTVGAFNALLKTLEEPPSHVIFILATTEPHKIPATILSRCQRFDFKKIPSKKIVERLKFIVEKEQISIEEEALYEIARLSDGGMRDSISMLDQTLSYADDKVTIADIHEINGTLSQKELSEFISNFIDGNLKESLDLIDKYDNFGKNLVKLGEEILLFLKNVLIYKNIPNYFEDSSSLDYKNLSLRIENELLLELIDSFNETINKLKNTNDPKLILELIIIKYSKKCKENVKEKQNIEKEEEKPLEKIELESKPEAVLEEKIKILPPTIEMSEQSHSQREEEPDNIPSKIMQIQTIRTNNALVNFDKKAFINIKNQLDSLHDFLLIPEYASLASMVLDGELKAANEKNMIFVYESSSVSEYFNRKLIDLEEMIQKIYNQEYKLIAVDKDTWEIIKQEFNRKEKDYTFQDEPFDIKSILINPEKQNVEKSFNDLFGDIVEYN